MYSRQLNIVFCPIRNLLTSRARRPSGLDGRDSIFARDLNKLTYLRSFPEEIVVENLAEFRFRDSLYRIVTSHDYRG